MVCDLIQTQIFTGCETHYFQWLAGHDFSLLSKAGCPWVHGCVSWTEVWAHLKSSDSSIKHYVLLVGDCTWHSATSQSCGQFWGTSHCENCVWTNGRWCCFSDDDSLRNMFVKMPELMEKWLLNTFPLFFAFFFEMHKTLNLEYQAHCVQVDECPFPLHSFWHTARGQRLLIPNDSHHTHDDRD